MPSSTLPCLSGDVETTAPSVRTLVADIEVAPAAREEKLVGPKLVIVWVAAVTASWICLLGTAYALYGLFDAASG